MNKSKSKGIITTFLRYRYLLGNLISKDLKIKYRRSSLGVLWSFLNPILIMLVLNAVFSTIFGYSIENFPLYLISGQTLFGFFTEATNGAMMSVIGSAVLVKKVYVPKYIFPLEKCIYAFVNMLFSLVAVLLMLFMFRIPASWTMLLFPVPLVALLGFATGFGMILATLCVFFRDVQHLYSVVTTAWIYLTPLLYPIERLGDGFIYKVVSINPLTIYITYFRDVVIYGTMPTLRMNLLAFGYAAVFLVAGFLIFKAKQDKFILHI